MKHQLWIIRDKRWKRDRHGKSVRHSVVACERDLLCLAGTALSYRGAATKLSPLSARLLLGLMVARPGHPLTRDELLTVMYDTPDDEADGNPVSVHLTDIRLALGKIGAACLLRSRGQRRWELVP